MFVQEEWGTEQSELPTGSAKAFIMVTNQAQTYSPIDVCTHISGSEAISLKI
jgi:hypothetical protein